MVKPSRDFEQLLLDPQFFPVVGHPFGLGMKNGVIDEMFHPGRFRRCYGKLPDHDLIGVDIRADMVNSPYAAGSLF